MKNSMLAVLGGDPVIEKPFPSVKTIKKEEITVAQNVLKSGA